MIRLALPVLMFHHVETAPAGELEPPPIYRDSYLDRRQFEAVLDALAGRGHTTLTLADAVARQRAGRPLPRRPVVLTFDDGCRCFADHAAPALAARGMTATLFAVSGQLGGANDWDRPPQGPAERREQLLDAAALRRLAAAGFEIGSHSRHHRDLTTCAEADLAAEVAGSRADLESALGQPVATFCYPYGAFDARARAAVAGAGYLAAAAIHGVSAAAAPGAAAGDPLALQRFAVNPGDSRFELLLKATGAYPWWSHLPRLGLLRAMRRRGAAPKGAPAVVRRPR